MEKVPKELIVIGAGVIGLELGSVYHRLGSKVRFIEAQDHIGGPLDLEIAKLLQKQMIQEKMEFYLEHQLKKVDTKGERCLVTVASKEKKEENFEADAVLVSIGRVPYTKGLNCEGVGIKKDEKGQILVNNSFETSLLGVYAIGDVIEGPMLAHKASEEGVVLVESLAKERSHVHYISIPNVIYTSPEIATVGITAQEAEKKGLKVKVGSFPFLANSRAHCVNAKEGIVRIITEEKSDHIIGMHIMSEHASEMIALGSLAIEKGITAKELGALCFPHPTFSEAIKEAALSVHKRAIHY